MWSPSSGDYLSVPSKGPVSSPETSVSSYLTLRYNSKDGSVRAGVHAPTKSVSALARRSIS